jgi:hypothetical protein
MYFGSCTSAVRYLSLRSKVHRAGSYTNIRAGQPTARQRADSASPQRSLSSLRRRRRWRSQRRRLARADPRRRAGAAPRFRSARRSTGTVPAASRKQGGPRRGTRPEIRHIRASGACTLAANGRVDAEVSGGACRATGSTNLGMSPPAPAAPAGLPLPVGSRTKEKPRPGGSLGDEQQSIGRRLAAEHQ